MFLIDDTMVLTETKSYVFNKDQFAFKVVYYGPLLGTEARNTYLKNRSEITRMAPSDHAIIFLDLKLENFPLSVEEESLVVKWFGKYIDFAPGVQPVHFGLALLADLIENTQCKKTIAIASAHQEPLRDAISESLISMGGVVADPIEKQPILVGTQSVIQFTGILSNNLWENTLKRVFFAFANRNDDISWLLNPPELRGMKVDRWFPDGAHDENEPDSAIYVENVRMRYPRWDSFELSKILVSGDTVAKKSTFQGTVPLDALRDFWGEDLRLEGTVASPISWSDELALPTSPAFPFLVACRNFIRELQKGDKGKERTKTPCLRVITEGSDKRGNEFSIVCIGLEIEFNCDTWSLVEKTWLKYLAGADAQGFVDGEKGLTTSLFANAMQAKCLASNDVDGLRAVLVGCNEIVAFPFSQSDFTGVAWKTRVNYKRRGATGGATIKKLVRKSK